MEQEIVLLENEEINLRKIPSMDNIIEEFLRKFQSLHTVRRYRKVLKGFFLDAKIIFITDLASVNFGNLLDLIRNFTIIDSNRTKVNTLNIIRSFFNYLQFTYNYPKNPVSKQSFDMSLESASSSTRSLSEGEIINLIHNLKQNKGESQKDYRDYILIATMLITSLRISEVLQIDVSKIKQDNSTGQYYIEIMQKKNRLRKVLIPGKLLKDYTEYAERYNINGPLFTNIKNNVSERSGLTQFGSFKIIRERVKKYLGKTGIGNHSMRKSFIELANKRWISPVSVMKATGHSTLQMIKYYDTSNELSGNASSDIANVLLD